MGTFTKKLTEEEANLLSQCIVSLDDIDDMKYRFIEKLKEKGYVLENPVYQAKKILDGYKEYDSAPKIIKISTVKLKAMREAIGHLEQAIKQQNLYNEKLGKLYEKMSDRCNKLLDEKEAWLS